MINQKACLSIVKLTPNDTEDKKRFIEFRNNDVGEMFTYQCIFVTYYAVGYTLNLITSRSKSDYILVLL